MSDRGNHFALTCCAWHLLARPKGWVGHTTYCRCGTLLVLRDGVWRAE